MKAHAIILYLCLIVYGQYLITNAVRKNELKRNLKKGTCLYHIFKERKGKIYKITILLC